MARSKGAEGPWRKRYKKRWNARKGEKRVGRGRNERVEGGGWRLAEGERRLVCGGDLDAGEPFEALFDIRHDFIKHSSNVQTLYIELYLRPVTASPSLPRRPPPRTILRAPPFGVSTPCLPPKTPTVCCCATAYNETNVPGELVIPQYRIMYNYIAAGGGER